jgi:hypothetical protein
VLADGLPAWQKWLPQEKPKSMDSLRTTEKKSKKELHQNPEKMVPRPGLEPGTNPESFRGCSIRIP